STCLLSQLVTFLLPRYALPRVPSSFPTRRSSDLSSLPVSSRLCCPGGRPPDPRPVGVPVAVMSAAPCRSAPGRRPPGCAVPPRRSEEHTSELQSRENLVCRLLLEKKKKQQSLDRA